MKKYIYGIVDSRTNLLGDLCLLDRDEEFKAGCLNLFSLPSVPDYLVSDLQALKFGFVTFGDDDSFPHFDIYPIPVLILHGSSIEVVNRRVEDVSSETISENS